MEVQFGEMSALSREEKQKWPLGWIIDMPFEFVSLLSLWPFG